MPRIVRSADVAWEGTLSRGSGVATAGGGAFALPIDLPSRIGDPGGTTSPEELLAAAHGGCLSMSLAGELTSAGTPPERLEVNVKIVMDEVPGKGHLVIASEADAAQVKRGLEELGEIVVVLGAVIPLPQSGARVVWHGRLGG